MTWGFGTCTGGCELGREIPPLTEADRCIWRGCGTKLNPRQPARTTGVLLIQARACPSYVPGHTAPLPGFCRRPKPGGTAGP